MRWRSGRRSSNIEDRRRFGGGKGVAIGGGTAIILALVVLLLGGDAGDVLRVLSHTQVAVDTGRAAAPTAVEQDEATQFVSVVLADTEDTWNSLFAASSAEYIEPKMVLYSGAVRSACGFSSAAAGPFYCPGDSKVYLDLDFFRQLKQLGAKGDFAIAYVIAHEIGHHVQNSLGLLGGVQQAQQRLSKAEANALQVRVELQADCYAGIWAHHGQKQRAILEEGDVEEAMQAAAAVGDDRLQKMAGRAVHPESFTHGSSKQRMEWFRRGFQSGRVEDCNTLG